MNWKAAAGLRLPEATAEVIASLGEHRVLSTPGSARSTSRIAARAALSKSSPTLSGRAWLPTSKLAALPVACGS